ncbi:MAG: outer membrane beta-barrel protein [Prevotella sp.]|nr:outer membrane beta-barrel protein [Prevotella sp.]
MKKYVFILLLFSASFAQAQRQFGRHDLSFGIGLGANAADDAFNGFWNPLFEQHHLYEEGECFDVIGHSYVAWNAEYEYQIGRHWAVGLTASYAYAGLNGALEYDSEDPSWAPGYACVKSRMCYIAPCVKRVWRSADAWLLYSKASVGLQYNKMTFKATAITDANDAEQRKRTASFQLAIVGVELGKQRVRFYSEVGYGSQGVFKMGVKCAL